MNRYQMIVRYSRAEMSCLLEEVAAIGNPTEIVQWLCPHLYPGRGHGSPLPGTGSTHLTDIDWSEEWDGWNDIDHGGGGKGLTVNNEDGSQKRSSPSSPSPQPEASWLTECITAISPTCDLMAIGYKNRLAILSRRWENLSEEKEGMKLVTTWRGTVGYAPNDEISAVLCLPLISQKQSSTGGPDWTCIVVGFTSGYVAMYTENGLVLLSQQFEEGVVLSLTCRTHPAGSPLVLAQDGTEELVMLYPRAITTIDGFSLFQTLRGCRNQVAKAAASGGDTVTVPPLGYKKWGLVDQGMVTDCVAPGLCPPSIYDHMAQTSIAKGFNHSVFTAVPATSLHITTGRAPFTGFLTAHEGSAPPFMADVARLYASKLKDALVSAASGWLFGKSKIKDADQSKMKPKIEPATPLPYRWSLPDKPRLGLSISIASGRRLGAITDDLGRVTLIDVQKGIAVRMWKGYRDADCGWVEVEGEWGGTKRWVTFLLIYAPRRGLLEVWMPQQGPRVAAFNVPKQSRLIYTPHTLLGANSVRGVRCKVFPVIFISPDGTMTEVTIPFHLALGGKTSKRARDLHLLKTLKLHIKSGNDAEVLTVMCEIKTMAVRKQAVATLILSQHLTISLLQGLLDLFLPLYGVEEEVEAREDIHTLDHESRLFGQQLVRLRQLLGLYLVLSQLHAAREASPDPEDNLLVVELAKILVLTPKETTDLITACGYNERFKAGSTKKVTFSDGELVLNVGSFIRCWDVSVGVLARDTGISALPIDLKGDIQVEKKIRLGELLYGWKWHRESIRKFHQAVEASGTNPESLLHLALEHWLQGPTSDTVATLHFGMVVHTLSYLAESKILCDVSEQSTWWTAVRDRLVASEQPFHAYMAALLCRGVHATLETKAHLNREKDNVDTEESEEGDREGGTQATAKSMSLNDWEGLSMEMVEWNLVLWQLGCLLPLSRLSSCLPCNGPEKQLKLEVSVKSLLDKGKGYVAELVANWFIGSGMPLSAIKKILTRHDEQMRKKQQVDMEVDEVEEKTQAVLEDATFCEEKTEDELCFHEEIFDLLEKVGDKFPHSVAGDSVLTNMAWELAAAWHKNPDDVTKLLQAVAHIEVIKNSHIRHGVSVMIWETWVSRSIQSALGLVEKVGRLPKDRLCRRDLGLGEHSLAQVFKAASGILEQVLEANVVCEVEKPLVLTADRFWSGQEGSPSLVELTIMQKMTCYDLVYHHQQLLSVLFFIAHLNLKNMKPLSCFGGKGRSVFFKPLSTSWTFEGQADPSVSKARMSLMCKVISTTVNALPDNTSPSQGIAPSVRRALDLTRDWNMAADPLYRQYICELYNSGFDKQAEEVIPLASDQALLGSQLVLLSGQRLHHHLETSTCAAHHQALTSPAITEWLKSLDSGSLRCPGVPLNHSLELLNHALHLLAEGTQEYRMATALHQTFSAFIQDEEADLPT